LPQIHSRDCPKRGSWEDKTLDKVVAPNRLGIDTAQWGQDDSISFLEYGKFFVPDREVQIDHFVRLIPPAVDNAHIVEIGCGEGLLAAAVLEAHPNVTYSGLDGSTMMLDHAKRRLAPYGTRFEAREFQLAGRDWRQFRVPVHAFISSLVIHHLDGEQKRVLYGDLLSQLAPSGALLIADLTLPTTREGRLMAARAWDDAVRQRSLQLSGSLGPFEAFCAMGWNYYSNPAEDPIDRPSGIFHQLQWLEDVGFKDVDVFWMRAGHALFGGRKSPL
jgi:tRNA (cmo5U34)-methyltransferase